MIETNSKYIIRSAYK